MKGACEAIGQDRHISPCFLSIISRCEEYKERYSASAQVRGESKNEGEILSLIKYELLAQPDIVANQIAGC